MRPRNLHLTIPPLPDNITPNSSLPASACPTEVDPHILTSLFKGSSARYPRSSGSSPYPGSSISDVLPSPFYGVRIREGSFIVFSLDISLIANSYKDSRMPELYEALRSLPVKRYLGLVTWSSIYRNEDSPQDTEELVVNFVGSRPPPALSGLDKLCMHIAPTVADDPSALKTSEPFPYEDLLLWTTCGTRIWIEQLNDSFVRFSLSKGELARLEERIVHDKPAFNATLAADDVESAALESLRVPEEYHIPVQVWRDVERVDELDDPAGIVAEVEAVLRLVEQHQSSITLSPA